MSERADGFMAGIVEHLCNYKTCPCDIADRIRAVRELATARAEVKTLREALTRLRDCDWTISLPDRMDAVRDIARAALADKTGL